MSRINNKYSKELKLKAVKMYLEEGLASTKIAKELGIPNKNTVMMWVKRYNELGEDYFDTEIRGKHNNHIDWRKKKYLDSKDE